jgi:hypothetical protein
LRKLSSNKLQIYSKQYPLFIILSIILEEAAVEIFLRSHDLRALVHDQTSQFQTTIGLIISF